LNVIIDYINAYYRTLLMGTCFADVAGPLRGTEAAEATNGVGARAAVQTRVRELTFVEICVTKSIHLTSQ